MKDKRTRRLEAAFRWASLVILLASLAMAVFWIVFPDALNLEPYLVLLGLVYAAVPLLGRWLINKLNRDLKHERLTIAYALAYGYLHNYLVPVVRRLRKGVADPSQLTFFVFLPTSLAELHREAIDEQIVELKHQAYDIETVALDFPDQKRRRDFRTARKVAEDAATIKYFDFPTTLLVLEKVIEYKLKTQEDAFWEAEREEMERTYIHEFKDHLTTMLAPDRFKAVRSNIRLVEGEVSFRGNGEAALKEET